MLPDFEPCLSALPLAVGAFVLFGAAKAPGSEVLPALHTNLTTLDFYLDVVGWIYLLSAFLWGYGWWSGYVQKELIPKADAVAKQQPQTPNGPPTAEPGPEQPPDAPNGLPNSAAGPERQPQAPNGPSNSNAVSKQQPQASNDLRELLKGTGALALFVALAAVAVTLDFTKRDLIPPAPVVITAWVILLAYILARLTQIGRRWHVPLLSLLIVSALVWGWLDVNDNHELRRVEGLSRAPLRPVDVAFGEWLTARRDRNEFGSQPYPVFLVAAEGGGLRAAYFTGLVLDELQARCARFAQHTFLISGVSGGSLGAALFAEGLRRDGARNEAGLLCSTSPKPSDGDAAARQTQRALRADLLSRLLVGLLFPDLLQRFVPFPIQWLDRARQLENSFANAWEATGGRDLNKGSFYDVWQGTEHAIPALMLNTTNVETGHRMVVSHLSFPGGPRPDLETLADVNPDLNIPLSTAAILSARFPLITPAGTVRRPSGRNGSANPPKARYVDGGYFENSGLATILDVVEAVRQKAVRHNVRLVIISIETSAAITRYPIKRSDDSSYPGFEFGELLSPLRALLNTQQARGELAKLEAKRVAERLHEGCTGVPQEDVSRGCIESEVITFAIRPGKVPVPLGWALSNSARVELERQLVDNEEAVSRVLQHVTGRKSL